MEIVRFDPVSRMIVQVKALCLFYKSYNKILLLLDVSAW